MNKLFLLFTSTILLLSCSKESVSEVKTDTTADLSTTFNSNLGDYYGVFTTMNSKYRATVKISLPYLNDNSFTKSNLPTAKVIFKNGDVYYVNANSSVSSGDIVNDLEFISEDISFNFSVEENGNNPLVTNVIFKTMPSDIIVLKQKSMLPPLALTGTYVCVDCGSHPLLGTGVAQTFNMIFPDDGITNTTDISTQILLGTNNYGISTGNSQTNVTNSNINAILSGNIQGSASNSNITWSGYHYDTTLPNQNEITGSWYFNSGNYGLLSGTFANDDFVSTLYFECYNNFDGSGITPNPAIGQLDSNIVKVTGMSDGSMNYGDTQTTGDFARGLDIDGGVTTGGIYSFETLSAGDRLLGVQPGGSDFTPGTIEYKVQNTKGSDLSSFNVYYVLFINNDNSRSNSFNLSYSLDGTNFTLIPSLDHTSIEASDGLGFQSNIKFININETVANGDYIYFRFWGTDVSGSGSRDEFGITNFYVRGN